MRFIILDENSKVVGIREGSSAVISEIQSDTGELGQIMQPDGTFIDNTSIIEQPLTQLDEIQNTIDIILLKQDGIL